MYFLLQSSPHRFSIFHLYSNLSNNSFSYSLQGVSPEFRNEIWPFLLGVFSPHSTTSERTTELTKLEAYYNQLANTPVEEATSKIIGCDVERTSFKDSDSPCSTKTKKKRNWFSGGKKNKTTNDGKDDAEETINIELLRVRLANILSAYAVHDPEINYCQGMSDLAAPFIQKISNDALAFACFEKFMKNARNNFKHDESGISSQLQTVSNVLKKKDPVLYKKLEALDASHCHFAFKMVLVMLRRDLPLNEALALWEVKWVLEAQQKPGASTEFISHFVAEAVCAAFKGKVLTSAMITPNVMQVMNEIKIDFWAVLKRARNAF